MSSTDAVDEFYRELFAVYSGVFSSRVWSEPLGDEFGFEQVTANGAVIHAKPAFLAQLEYLSVHAGGRMAEHETQREQLQPGNPCVFRSTTAGSLLDPATGQSTYFAHINEITVCLGDRWKIVAISFRDQ